MKNKKYIALILFVLIIILCGCSKKHEEVDYSGILLNEKITFPNEIVEQGNETDEVVKSINDAIGVINEKTSTVLFNTNKVDAEVLSSNENNETLRFAGQFGYSNGYYFIEQNKDTKEINNAYFYSAITEKNTDTDIPLSDEQIIEIKNNITNFYNSFIDSQNAKVVAASYYFVDDTNRTNVDINDFDINDVVNMFSKKNFEIKRILNYVIVFESSDSTPTEVTISMEWFGTVSIKVSSFR